MSFRTVESSFRWVWRMVAALLVFPPTLGSCGGRSNDGNGLQQFAQGEAGSDSASEGGRSNDGNGLQQFAQGEAGSDSASEGGLPGGASGFYSDAGGSGTGGGTRELGSGSITVTALIDGRSLLELSPTGVRWQHLECAGPGMQLYQTVSTTVEATIDGSITTYDWCPTWANGCNTCDGTCGELREEMSSEPLSLIVFPGPVLTLSFSCTSRWLCTLLQTPGPDNGNVAVIDMDDYEPSDSDFYSATLDFTYVRL